MRTASEEPGGQGEQGPSGRLRFAVGSDAFALLVARAGAGQRIAYSDFAVELGLPSPRGLGWLLTPMLDWCRANGLPLLPILVVRKSDGLPSGPYGEGAIEAETARVFAFDWRGVPSPMPGEIAAYALPRRLHRP